MVGSGLRFWSRLQKSLVIWRAAMRPCVMRGWKPWYSQQQMVSNKTSSVRAHG